MITPRILINNLLSSICHIEALLDEAKTQQATTRETTHPHQERLRKIWDLISTAIIKLKDIKDGNRTWTRYGLYAKTTELNKLKASIKNIKRWELRLHDPTNNQNKEDSAPDNNRPLDIDTVEQKDHNHPGGSPIKRTPLPPPPNHTKTSDMSNIRNLKERIHNSIQTAEDTLETMKTSTQTSLHVSYIRRMSSLTHKVNSDLMDIDQTGNDHINDTDLKKYGTSIIDIGRRAFAHLPTLECYMPDRQPTKARTTEDRELLR